MTAELDAGLRAAVVRIAQARHLLVALDFDGTMSPLVPRAEDARPLPASAAALAALASLESTTTALVSGRALSSLRGVAAPPARTLLVGSHGAETWWGPHSPALTLTEPQAHALRRAVEAVEAAAQLHPGLRVEHKPAGVVLHYRQAAPGPAATAVAQLHSALAEDPGVYLSVGKMVLEASVIKANKGESLTLLREFTEATAVFFAGDDVTDEHAFAVLEPGDLGLKVGDGPTAAAFRIESPHALPAVLELLLAARKPS